MACSKREVAIGTNLQRINKKYLSDSAKVHDHDDLIMCSCDAVAHYSLSIQILYIHILAMSTRPDFVQSKQYQMYTIHDCNMLTHWYGHVIKINAH